MAVSAASGGDLAIPPCAQVEQLNVTVPQFIRDGGGAWYFWSQDADGNIATITDTAIYSATWSNPDWSPAAPFAGVGDGYADQWPRLAYDSGNNPHLIWVKSGIPLSADLDNTVDRLYLSTYDNSNSTWTTPTVIAEAPNIIEPLFLADQAANNRVVVWQARSASGMDLWYVVYDSATMTWSKPKQYTDDADMEWAYVGYFNSSTQVQVFSLDRIISDSTVAGSGASPAHANVNVANTITVPTFSTSNLAGDSHTLARDLTLDGLALSTANPAPGSAVALTATVRNSGDFAMTAVTVTFLYQGALEVSPTRIGLTQTLPYSLPAGYTGTVSVNWSVPPTATTYAVSAQVDPAKQQAESIESNNALTLTTVLPDLVVDWAYTTFANDGSLTVQAGVRNVGVSQFDAPFVIALRADDPLTGPTVLTTTANETLAVGQSLTVTFALTAAAAILTGAHSGWVVADSEATLTEADEANNAEVTSLNVLPDLALAANDITGDGPFVVTVRNPGYLPVTNVIFAAWSNGLTGTLVYSGSIASIASGGSAQVIIPAVANVTTLFVIADPDDALAEGDESNNLATHRAARPIAPYQLFLPLVRRP